METKINYTEEVGKVLEVSQKLGREHQNAHYTGAHLLKAMLGRDFSLLKPLEALGVDVFFLEEWAEVRIEECPKTPNNYRCEPDESIDEIFAEADAVRELLGEEHITLFALMVAISSPGVAFSFDQMKTFPVTREDLLKDQALSPISVSPTTTHTPKKGFLQNYCMDRIKEGKKAKVGKEEENQGKSKKSKGEILVGREGALQQITEILCRYHKQNVLMIGDHGVGKTQIINGFVQKVIAHQVPDILDHLAIFELDLGALIAGASYKGEIEDRLKNIANELRPFPKSVLIIEDIHALLGSHGNDTGIGNLLKSELSKGLTIIATTTIEEYTKKLEKDQGLAGMFELLNIEEADDETHFRMLKQALMAYENHHQISIDDEGIMEAIRLSKRYLKEKSLPASAIDLVDHTMAVLKTAGETFLKEKNQFLTQMIELEDNSQNYSDSERKTRAEWLVKDIEEKTKYLRGEGKNQQEKGKEEKSVAELLSSARALIHQAEMLSNEKRSHLTALDLAMMISQKTNIPIGKLQEEEQKRLNEIETILAERVVGQDHAIGIVSEAILESRSGLSKAGQPIASFFFLGPTGTGKTELAKSLAEFLFQDENAIIRFDMSEFKEEHSAALLYGAPPGYVGYEEGGLLVNKIRQKPYSIVLFDEIEKAHASVFDVFLQMMDEGKLHDRLGKEGDFSNAIILFTSNIGSDFIVESFSKGQIPNSAQLLEKMAPFFRPEFLGRLTETIPFAPISKENAVKIFEIHLKKELLDLVEPLGIALEISEEVKEHLANEGYDMKYGSRPLKGVIRARLRRPLAKKIIAGEFKEGDKVKVMLENGEIRWGKG